MRLPSPSSLVLFIRNRILGDRKQKRGKRRNWGERRDSNSVNGQNSFCGEYCRDWDIFDKIRNNESQQMRQFQMLTLNYCFFFFLIFIATESFSTTFYLLEEATIFVLIPLLLRAAAMYTPHKCLYFRILFFRKGRNGVFICAIKYVHRNRKLPRRENI